MAQIHPLQSVPVGAVSPPEPARAGLSREVAPKQVTDCARCGQRIPGTQGYVLYTSPDPHDSSRVVVHGGCIADDAQAGRVRRVSGFAFRAVSR